MSSKTRYSWQPPGELGDKLDLSAQKVVALAARHEAGDYKRRHGDPYGVILETKRPPQFGKGKSKLKKRTVYRQRHDVTARNIKSDHYHIAERSGYVEVFKGGDYATAVATFWACPPGKVTPDDKAQLIARGRAMVFCEAMNKGGADE